MPEQSPQTEDDLFFNSIITPYVTNPRFLRRDWLAAEVDKQIQDRNCRFVLLTAEPGAGKSTFMAQIAADHPDWLRYFIRRDQRTPLGGISAKDFLRRIGYQLAARHPELFNAEQVKIVVAQRIGSTGADSQVVGAEVTRLLASPFHRKVLEIQQEVQQLGGPLVGLKIDTLVTDPTLLDLEDLQNMALHDPAHALLLQAPDQRITILVDALDELRYHSTTDNILTWLTNCPELSPNVRFVLSSRPPERALEVFCQKQQRSLQELPIHEAETHVQADLQTFAGKLTDSPLVKVELAALGKSAAEFQAQAVTKAEGNIGYLDAIGLAIDQAQTQPEGHSARQALRELLSLHTLPPKLAGLHAFFLHQIKALLQNTNVPLVDRATGQINSVSVWDMICGPVLGILAVAYEPLTIAHFCNFGSIPREYTRYVADALDRLRQFLHAREGQYRLYHSSLAEFLTDDQTRLSVENADLYFDPVGQHHAISDYYLRTYKTGPDLKHWSECDLYGLRYLPPHLIGAGQDYSLRELLIDFNWMMAKLRQAGVNDLLSDYDIAPVDEALRLLRDALRLSAHILVQDPTQLPSQLHGRLIDSSSPELRALLEMARQQTGYPWLHPITASLQAPGGLLLRTLSDHPTRLTSVVVTPDGSQAISACADGTIHVWDLVDWSKTRTINAHEDEVSCLALTPDGKRMISGSNDKTLKVWDLAAGRAIGTLTGHNAGVKAIAISADGRFAVSASLDMTLKIWNLETLEYLRTLKGHSSPVAAVAITPDGQRAVSASWDNSLKVWSLTDNQNLFTLEGHGSLVQGVAVTPDGRRAISASYDTNLIVWDLERGVKLHSLMDHQFPVNAVVITPDGRQAISASNDYTVKVWDWDHAALICSMKGHFNPVVAVAVTPDGRRVISASMDFTMKVWRLPLAEPSSPHNSGVAEQLKSDQNHNWAVWDVTVTPDGHYAVTASKDSTLKVWDLSTGSLVHTLLGHIGGVTHVLVMQDSRLAISAAKDHTVRLWDIERGCELGKLGEHEFEISTLARTTDGYYVVSASRESIKVWDLAYDPESGNVRHTELYSLPGSSANHYLDPVVIISPDNRYLITIIDGDTIRLTGLVDGLEIYSTKVYRDGAHDLGELLAITPDGSHLVCPSAGNLMIIRSQNGFLHHTIPISQQNITSMAISPDGRRIFATSLDGTLKMCDFAGEAAVQLIFEGLDWPDKLFTTPNGKIIGLISKEKLILWDSTTEHYLASFQADGMIYCRAATPDSRTIIVGDAAGRVHILRIESDPVICRGLG